MKNTVPTTTPAFAYLSGVLLDNGVISDTFVPSQFD